MIRNFTGWKAALSLVLAGLSGTAAGQTAEEFYAKNNRLTLLIGFGAGTGYDVWGRIVTQHMAKHMPGKPAFIMQHMPGAGSLAMANFLYNAAPKDGTVIGSFSRNLPSQVMIGLPNANLDPRKFGYVGSPELPVRVCVALASSGVTSVAELRKTEVMMGGTGVATVPTFMPSLINKLAGTRFKVIDGYKSADDVYLAMERGEVHGICQGYAPIMSRLGDGVRAGRINFLFNFEERRDPQLNGAPSIFEFIDNPEDRQMLTFINSSTELGRPYAAPPGIPVDRLRVLRQAFEATLKDPDFLRDAQKHGLDVTMTTGEGLEKIVNDLYSIPKPLIERANALISKKQ
jgi:tripartite-type tricarboxylate transporter receptor subunit TctC